MDIPRNALNETLPGLNFVIELDRLKSILRQTLLHDKTRRENSAEHSWHLATAVLVLSQYANEPLNLERALKMALIHDVVEIDADDTFIYDEKANLDKAEREQKAATRLFGMLPANLATELRGLWDAYEIQACPESKFVGALDRLLPMLANFRTEGFSWKKHGITKQQVLSRNQKIENGSAALWTFTSNLIDLSVSRGYLKD